MKREMAVLLSVIVVLASVLGGCSGSGNKVTVESLAQAGSETVNGAESMDLSMLMDMGMTMEYLGVSFELGMTMDLDIRGHMPSQSSYVSGTIAISMLGMTETLDLESYTVKEDDHLIEYTRTAEDGVDDGWYCGTVDSGSTIGGTTDIYDYMTDNAEAFTLAEETVEVDGESCYAVSGTLSGELLSEILGGMDLNSFLGEDGGIEFEDFSMDLTCYFKESDSTPFRLDIHYLMDLAYPSDGDMDVSVDTMTLVLEYRGFDSVDEITVPEEVAAAALGVSASSEDAGYEADEREEDLYGAEEDDWYTDWSDYDLDDYEYEYNGGILAGTEGLDSFTVDGVSHALEGPVRDYLDNGWQFPWEQDVVEPDDFSYIWLEKGSETIYLGIYNPGEEECLEGDCLVYSVSVDSDDGVSFALDAGVSWGMSWEEVEVLVGSYTERYVYEEPHEMAFYYWLTEDDGFELCLTYTDGELSEIDVTGYGLIG